MQTHKTWVSLSSAPSPSPLALPSSCLFRLLPINKVLDNLVHIAVPSTQQQDVVGGHGGAARVGCKSLEVLRDALWESLAGPFHRGHAN